MSATAEREKIILDASLRVFSRYGVKRATMADLAEEAGISRSSLYNWDDVLRALIRSHTDRAIAEAEAAPEGVDDPGAQLGIF